MRSKYLKLITFSIILASCRYYVNYDVTPNEKVNSLLSLSADAYDSHLVIEIKINSLDSIFIENIELKPNLKDWRFPDFRDFTMESFCETADCNLSGGSYTFISKKSNPKEKIRLENFSALSFDSLPKFNRLSNIEDHLIKYTANYESKMSITLENFNMKVKVTLIDKSGKKFIEEESFVIKGKSDYYFSVH